MEILEGDKNYHVVSLCVSNSVGSKSSSNVAFHSLKIGKQVPSPQLLLSTSGRGRGGVQRGSGTGFLTADKQMGSSQDEHKSDPLMSSCLTECKPLGSI